MKDPNRFYVYVDHTDAGVPFYVGKGTLGRVREKRRNKKHTGVSSKYGFNRVLDRERVTAEDASLREIELIALHKLNVYKHPDNELACNFTDDC